MSEPTPARPLSAAEAREIDQICDRFEADCKAGERPQLDDYLGSSAEPMRTALLRQLLLLEMEYASRDPRTQSPDDTPWAGGTRGAADPALPAPPSGAAASRYELLNEVGHGGIGIVFRGRDRRLRRDLAVKVLRESLQRDPEAERRFVEEARVCSQLQHPAIVPVYELGWLSDGRPFFTMKLVEGHTLAALLRARGSAADDLPRLLGVFAQVCQAMAYAHTRGVVHRDLKPANVMVGSFGEVQVMDWGFAKVLATGVEEDETSGRPVPGAIGASHSGMLMGTPAYMPPEQARGEVRLIDARADVFALGAMLCEILTGRPPYTGDHADAICRKAAAGDLANARARLDKCSVDPALRRLAHACLAAARDDRPADASRVANELKQYFDSAQERAAQAQREQAAAEERARAARAKANAERRAGRITRSLAAALLLGATIATWQALVANRAKKLAVDAAEAESTAKIIAQGKETETSSVLAFVEQQIISAARPEGEDGGLGPNVTMRRALEEALPALDTKFTDQPLVEARLRRTVGKSFLLLGDAATAVTQFSRSRDLYSAGRGPEGAETLDAANDLATALLALGKSHEARRLHAETLATRRAKFGASSHEALQSMENLAIAMEALSQHAEAADVRLQVLRARETQLPAGDPAILYAMGQLSSSYYYLNRREDALRLGEQAHVALEKKLGPTHKLTLVSANNLALSYSESHRYKEATALLRKVIDASSEIRGPYQRSTLTAQFNLAKVLTDAGDHEAALKEFQKTLELQQQHLPPNHPDIAQSYYSLGNSHGFLKHYEESLKYHSRALELRRAQLGNDHLNTIYSMWGVAHKLLKTGRGADAIPLIDECLDRALEKNGGPHFFMVTDMRIEYFEKLKDAEGCRATAERWERFRYADADSLYHAARYRAITAKVLRATDADAARAEADKAMARLSASAAAGYKKLADARKSADFEAVHDRPDFHKLVHER